MMRKGRMRRAVRWGGVALTVILPVVWAASLLRFAYYRNTAGGWIAEVAIGGLRVMGHPGIKNVTGPAWKMAGYETPARPIVWLPHWGPLTGNGWVIDIPLWIPWLPAAGFTAWRFRADRVKSPRVCTSCGYDKTGLDAAAACPECGAAARPPVVPGG